MFDAPYYIEMYDFEHSVDEDRYIAIGKVGDGELYYDQNINY